MPKKNTDHSHRGFKGIWIPRALWLREDLKLAEKVMIAEIDSLDQEGKGCHATNAYFARFFGVTPSRIQQILRKLIAMNEVKMEMRTEWNRVLWAVKNYTGDGESSTPPMEETPPPLHGESSTPITKYSSDNKNDSRDAADASLVSFDLNDEKPAKPKKGAKNEEQTIREAQAEALLAKYPKRPSCSIVVAVRIIASAIKKEGYASLSNALGLYIARTKDWEEQYIKRPENWFKQEGWEEEYRLAELRTASKLPSTGDSKRGARRISATETREWERQQ